MNDAEFVAQIAALLEAELELDADTPETAYVAAWRLAKQIKVLADEYRRSKVVKVASEF